MGTVDHFTAARATLVELLKGSDLPEITGMWDLDHNQRKMLVITSCAEVISTMLVLDADRDVDMALEGAALLYEDMQDHIRKLCEEKRKN